MVSLDTIRAIIVIACPILNSPTQISPRRTSSQYPLRKDDRRQMKHSERSLNRQSQYLKYFMDEPHYVSEQEHDQQHDPDHAHDRDHEINIDDHTLDCPHKHNSQDGPPGNPQYKPRHDSGKDPSPSSRHVPNQFLPFLRFTAKCSHHLRASGTRNEFKCVCKMNAACKRGREYSTLIFRSQLVHIIYRCMLRGVFLMCSVCW